MTCFDGHTPKTNSNNQQDSWSYARKNKLDVKDTFKYKIEIIVNSI